MLRLQRIITGYAESRNSNVDNRYPAFDLVMSSPVHPVGKSDRGDRSSGFQTGKSRRIVHHVVGNQDFFAPASLEISGGSIVQTAKNGDAGEQQDVSPVPKSMGWKWLDRRGLRLSRWRGRERRCGRRCAGLLGHSRIERENAACQYPAQNPETTGRHFGIVARKGREGLVRCGTGVAVP